MNLEERARLAALKYDRTLTGDALEEQVQLIIDDWEDLARIGRGPLAYQEDTPSVDNCDDAGTGEGRYHGRM